MHYFKVFKKIFIYLACFWRYNIITNLLCCLKLRQGASAHYLLYVTTLYERFTLLFSFGIDMSVSSVLTVQVIIVLCFSRSKELRVACSEVISSTASSTTVASVVSIWKAEVIAKATGLLQGLWECLILPDVSITDERRLLPVSQWAWLFPHGSIYESLSIASGSDRRSLFPLYITLNGSREWRSNARDIFLWCLLQKNHS